jgi:hypothetical protein
VQHVRIAPAVSRPGGARPSPVARAARGLRLRWTWLRLSHRFRWAHRPLCDRFSADLIAVFGTHLCRSCVCVYLGALLSAGAWLAGWPLRDAAPALGLLTGAVAAASALPRYKRLPRPVRDLLRLSTGALGVAGLLLAGQGRAAGFAILGVFALAYLALRRPRQARRAAACDGCPELGRGRVCSGFTLQADASRRLDALTEPWLALALLPSRPKGSRP